MRGSPPDAASRVPVRPRACHDLGMRDPAAGLLVRTLRGTIREAVLDALAVLLPVSCAGCGLPDRGLCAACRLRCAADPVVRALPDGTPVVSALRYEAMVRRTILAFKEEGRTDVVRPLARAIGAAIDAAAILAGTSTDATIEVSTVPATRSGRRRRGYRPVDLLVHAAGLRASPVLAVVAATTQQKALGRDERDRNLRNSMLARRPLTGRRFLLVDDILTTGATLGEAARAIRAAGGEVTACATLAFTPRLIGGGADLEESVRDFHRNGGYGV